MIKGQPATADSKMLENFIAPFSAAVVERLEAAGVQIVGRFETSEFGVGGLFDMLTDTVNCQKDCQENRPRVTLDCQENRPRVNFALCNDYTGAVSRAAAASGLFYLHPSYGTVSRYGLIPAVASMDQIGILCKTPEVGFQVLKIITGYDARDGVMASDEMNTGGSDSGRISCVSVEKVINNPSLFSIQTQVMQILCCAELSNNISRYDGIKFGYRAKEYNGLQELYKRSRTEAFEADVKLAAIIGAMVLSQENYQRYYDKAMRLRRLIRDSLKFDKYDVIKTDNPILSRLCGLPSLTTPEGVYIANAGCESVLQKVHEGSDDS